MIWNKKKREPTLEEQYILAYEVDRKSIKFLNFKKELENVFEYYGYQIFSGFIDDSHHLSIHIHETTVGFSQALPSRTLEQKREIMKKIIPQILRAVKFYLEEQINGDIRRQREKESLDEFAAKFSGQIKLEIKS